MVWVYRCLQGVGYIVLIGFAAMFIVPFLYMISIALRPDMEILTFPISLDPLIMRTGRFRFPVCGHRHDQLANQQLLCHNRRTTVPGVFQLFTFSYGRTGFARGNFPGKDVIFWLLMSAIMVPFTVTMIPSYILIARLALD